MPSVPREFLSRHLNSFFPSPKPNALVPALAISLPLRAAFFLLNGKVNVLFLLPQRGYGYPLFVLAAARSRAPALPLGAVHGEHDAVLEEHAGLRRELELEHHTLRTGQDRRQQAVIRPPILDLEHTLATGGRGRAAISSTAPSVVRTLQCSIGKSPCCDTGRVPQSPEIGPSPSLSNVAFSPNEECQSILSPGGRTRHKGHILPLLTTGAYQEGGHGGHDPPKGA